MSLEIQGDRRDRNRQVSAIFDSVVKSDTMFLEREWGNYYVIHVKGPLRYDEMEGLRNHGIEIRHISAEDNDELRIRCRFIQSGKWPYKIVTAKP